MLEMQFRRVTELSTTDAYGFCISAVLWVGLWEMQFLLSFLRLANK